MAKDDLTKKTIDKQFLKNQKRGKKRDFRVTKLE